MRNNCFVLLAVISLLFVQNCEGQVKENPKYLGVKFGDFDLDKITFKEDINTLFSKVKYIKLPRKDTYYDEVKKQEVIRDTLAFEYKIDPDDPNRETTYFLDRALRGDLVFFFVDKSNRLKAFSFFISGTEDLSKKVEQIDNKYKQYRVNLGSEKEKAFVGKTYQWETPDKIISVTVSSKSEDGQYTFGLAVVAKDTDFKRFPINRFIFSTTFYLDNSCKK
ncbi:hypothetical protein H7F33_01570 [Pedobacter sp. PAMC26386]|nr:hypothetical protein H7F33_01570 [Pedobacter sp. PAMC26386]